MIAPPQSTVACGTLPKGIANTRPSVADELPVAPRAREADAFLSSHLADLLVERGLNQAFLDAVEEHRRFQIPIVVTRNEQAMSLPVDQVGEEITRTKLRITELDAQIAREEAPFSLNEEPPSV